MLKLLSKYIPIGEGVKTDVPIGILRFLSAREVQWVRRWNPRGR